MRRCQIEALEGTEKLAVAAVAANFSAVAAVAVAAAIDVAEGLN